MCLGARYFFRENGEWEVGNVVKLGFRTKTLIPIFSCGWFLSAPVERIRG